MSQSLSSFWKSNSALILAVAVIVLASMSLIAVRQRYMFGKTVRMGSYGAGVSGSSMIEPMYAPAPDMAMKAEFDRSAASSYMPMPIDSYAPVATEDRLVVANAHVSMLVKDVRESVSKVQQVAESAQGFLVSSNVHTPEGGSAFGTASIRVPADQRDSVLSQLRDHSVRVVSENIDANDVTDEYVDIESRLAVLNDTKARFEALLDQATDIDDLLRVQRELVNLQAQIDSLVGRQQYLEQTARLSLITVNLSTDELALPYAPDNAWRPQVVFKTAVRSLLKTVRGVASFGIWVIVFAPLWVPTVGIVWWLSKRR